MRNHSRLIVLKPSGNSKWVVREITIRDSCPFSFCDLKSFIHKSDADAYKKELVKERKDGDV